MNRPWMKPVLGLAAGYNLLWGAWVILWPNALFDLAGIARPTYPQIWQCVGMIVGCYGLGYAIAATDPARWWPIVLVGFIGKVLGPIGFVYSAILGDFPWVFGLVNIFNDLIWWVPFALILWHAARGPDGPPSADTLDHVLEQAVNQHGQTLRSITDTQPTLVVCLRHFGCTFCREALADLKKNREAFHAHDVSLVLVHMSTEGQAQRYLSAHGMADVHRISDPSRHLYRILGLQRGNLWQLFGPITWWRGLSALTKGHGIGRLAGDGLQMPGVFLMHHGKLLKAFRHKSAADRPDYIEMGACTI